MILKVLNPNRNRCPRCKGNLAQGRDEDGDYLTCLMCNRTAYLDNTPDSRARHIPLPVLNFALPNITCISQEYPLGEAVL